MATPLAPPGAMNVRPRVSSRRIGIPLHYILIFRLPVGRTRYIRFFLIATRNAASLFHRQSSSVRDADTGFPSSVIVLLLSEEFAGLVLRSSKDG